MGAVTYPDSEVIAFLSSRVVPLQLPVDKEAVGERLHLRWTPYVLVLDAGQEVHRRSVGFQPPGELVPWTKLGLVAAAFMDKDWDQAIRLCQWVIEKYPSSYAAPEAVYMRGVARMRDTHDAQHLKQMLATLSREYPHSLWALKAQPYGLLK